MGAAGVGVHYTSIFVPVLACHSPLSQCLVSHANQMGLPSNRTGFRGRADPPTLCHTSYSSFFHPEPQLGGWRLRESRDCSHQSCEVKNQGSRPPPSSHGGVNDQLSPSLSSRDVLLRHEPQSCLAHCVGGGGAVVKTGPEYQL